VRVAVVGPTHPFKGGVAAHTTELARRLAVAGHDSELVSWSRLYPALLYPGEQVVPGGVPDLPPYPRTRRPLSWARPDSWWRAGRTLAGRDVVVLVHVVPAVVPALLTLIRSVRSVRSVRSARSAAGSGRPPRVLVLAHNVLPHEPHLGATALVRALLRRADAVAVHSADQARLARELGAPEVLELELPPHLPGGPAVPRPAHDGDVRLLALGLVRAYKGTDLLVRAVQQVPGVRLTVAGELWGEAGQQVRALAADPASAGRVALQEGYVPGPALAPLLAAHDVLALPYRSATASQNALLGQAHGLPVLASRVGTFGQDVRDGVDGLLVPPDDLDALVDALRQLVRPDVLERLRSGVRPPDLQARWDPYLRALVGEGRSSAVTPPIPAPPTSPTAPA
jgi:glycosyltransferase involved in cell wall biosynthesis